MVVWTFLALPIFGIGMKTEIFQSSDYCWVFQIYRHIECSTLTALSFRILNSSAGIHSPPPALFIIMLAKAHLTSHSRMSGSKWVTTPSWFSGFKTFFSILLCILASSSYSLMPPLGLYLFWPLSCPSLHEILLFSSVQSLSHVQLLVTPWTAAHQASLSITNSWSPPKLMSIDSMMPSNHLILCRPLLPLPSIFPRIKVFSNESALHIRWSKHWSFSFNISPSSEHPGLISFRMDWLDLLAVQGTLKSLLQYHSSKASIPWHSAFFTVQFLHPYMTTGKTIALTWRTFVGKVMSLLSNMLSRLVITSFQGASIFKFHGCNHHLQWFWSPKK